jgi:hypothetical protein
VVVVRLNQFQAWHEHRASHRALLARSCSA